MDRLPLLETPRVRLRTIEPSDVPALFAVFSDPRVMRYWSSPPLTDASEAVALQSDIAAMMREDTLYQWGIERRDADGLIGTVTLHRIDAAHRRGEIGFALGSAHWGHGYAFEAVGALIAYAFDALELHRLEADADPRNEASLRVLGTLGFVREGLARERYHLFGELQDSVLLGLLARDWRAGRGACRMAACRDARGAWEFVLINDGPGRIEDGTIEHVATEWGDSGRTRATGVAFPALAPGEHAVVWRDEEGDTEFRMSVRIRFTRGGRELRRRFEFPKLYRMQQLPEVAGLAREGVEAREDTVRTGVPNMR